MFNLFKKKEVDNHLYAPVEGTMIKIEEVPDQVFGTKMMGDGVAFQFEGSEVGAPADGELTMVAHTKHAFGIKTEQGVEVLVHIGLDTVGFQGEGFEVLVQEGSKVKKGQPIIKVDRTFMKEKNANLTTPMIVTNSAQFELQATGYGDVQLGQAIVELKSK